MTTLRKRVLLLAATTGYQTRSFGDAAGRLGVDLVFATDCCHLIDDPWRDGAIPIRFHEEEDAAVAIVREAGARPLDGILAVGDRPTVIAALVTRALGLPGHPPEAAAVSRNKLLTRERLGAARLPGPWFTALPLDAPPPSVSFPCVVKPLALSGSRGVIRADDPASLRRAVDRVRALLRQPDVRVMRDPASEALVLEGFIPGREYAIEGLMDRGWLRILAIFDKPDPLDGPFFEETIYVTEGGPSEGRMEGRPQGRPLRTDCVAARIEDAVRQAVAALGLRHGPIHAECRVNDAGVFVLEVAARPIGGLCARALRFVDPDRDARDPVSLEELLLRHAIGENVDALTREAAASGVMMIPIPARGVYRRVDGLDDAAACDGVVEIRITAKPDQVLVPLPEGASYLGFIFARGDTGAAVEQALREAHARLRFVIDRELAVTR